MTDPLVKAIAMALFAHRQANYKGPTQNAVWDDLADWQKEYGYGQARAALAVIGRLAEVVNENQETSSPTPQADGEAGEKGPQAEADR